jgi:hypothetical protein
MDSRPCSSTRARAPALHACDRVGKTASSSWMAPPCATRRSRAPSCSVQSRYCYRIICDACQCRCV